MRITPFRVLEQHARTEYRRRFASAPAPRFLNARATIQLDAPRSMVWGGVGYWAPPLSFEDGERLFALSSFLADALRQKSAAAHEAAQLAVPFIRRILRRRKPPAWRVFARVLQAAAAQKAFSSDQPEEVLAHLHWLLFVEDESPAIPSETQVTIDLIDNRYVFEGHFKRPPRSWKDYIYGMRHIGRQATREDLRSAVATRVGVNADEKGWRTYERDMRAASGW